MFFRAQVFQGPEFLGSRFFWVRVQGPGPGFRSSPFFTEYLQTTACEDGLGFWPSKKLLMINMCNREMLSKVNFSIGLTGKCKQK